MIPIKFKRIEIRKPRYDPHPEKSTTNNSEWRQGLFIVFENYQGQEMDWMPKWNELEQIKAGQKEIEDKNKQLAREKAS